MPGIVALFLALAFWLHALEAHVRERVEAVRAVAVQQADVEPPGTVEGVDALRFLIQSELDDPPTRRASGTHAAPDAPFRVALLHALTRGRPDESYQHAPRRQPIVAYDATAPPTSRPELRSH